MVIFITTGDLRIVWILGKTKSYYLKNNTNWGLNFVPKIRYSCFRFQQKSYLIRDLVYLVLFSHRTKLGTVLFEFALFWDPLYTLAWKRKWNFLVVHVKSKRWDLYSNEIPQSIFHILQFTAELSRFGHNFTLNSYPENYRSIYVH